ncbi:hypothetical protein C8R45DRAFT_1096331 [Mycena sanguinolenta]|nr:hypothetical protein C8R45DRAFT_1103579 [Mycena sanguinolenta]KAJ6492317.1 hypothetical protein C8R45DRAFT_1096331 [Mycena sanguinolenta]
MLVLALASSLVVHTITFLYFLVIPVNAHLFANDSRPLRALPSFSQPMTEHDAPLAYQWFPIKLTNFPIPKRSDEGGYYSPRLSQSNTKNPGEAEPFKSEVHPSNLENIREIAQKLHAAFGSAMSFDVTFQCLGQVVWDALIHHPGDMQEE